jgi:hypothetical protein
MARRLLVIANETVASPRVVEEVLRRADPGAQVHVVAPALRERRLDHFYGAREEEAQQRAAQRLEGTVAALRAGGLEVSGRLGDRTPQVALDDAFRMFGPDAIIVSTHPRGRSRWLERGLVERARAAYGVPVTHIVVDVEADAAEVAEDPRAAHLAPRAAERRVPVFHAAPYEEALRIRQGGFVPVADHGMIGVTTREPSDEAGVVFAVMIPESELEGAEPDGDGLRVPAAVLDRHGPPVEADAGHVE